MGHLGDSHSENPRTIDGLNLFMTNKSANKLLVVDDDSDVLDFLMELTEGKVSVSYASDGAKALELAKLHKPDLILLDIMMPEMDGFETCRRLKSDPDIQHIPVVFLTAKNDEKTMAEGLELGAIDYITKPFDPDIVVTKIENFLKQIEATRAAAAPKDRRAAAPAGQADRRADGASRPDRYPRENGEKVVERRAQGASRPDRFPKSEQKSQGMSFMQAMMIALLVVIVGGGGYAWYANTEMVGGKGADDESTSSPATKEDPAQSFNLTEQDIQSVISETHDKSNETTASDSATTSVEPTPVPSSMTPSTVSCGELPKVAWWGNATHSSIIAYVNTKNSGDWRNYIAKWERQLSKLRDIYSRGGTVVAPKVGTRLHGPSLSKYVSQVEKRVKISRCIAEIMQQDKP